MTRISLSPATEALCYDADGNLVADGRWTYSWDRENRLVKMESAYQTTPIAVPGYRLSFRYDGLSRRIEKKVETTPDGSSWTLKNWEGYVYDAWNLIMTVRFETNGAVRGRVASYVWGPDIASRAVGGAGSHWQAAGGVGGLLFVVDGSSVSAQYPASTDDAADDNFFPLMDRLGNVLAYAKVASATIPLPLRAIYDYDAFGRELRSSGPAADLVPFHFSTKFTDQESGLNYYGYRYYDPGKGRWLSRDPIGEPGGINLCGMVGNDAVNRWDYLGKASPVVAATAVIAAAYACFIAHGGWMILTNEFPGSGDRFKHCMMGCRGSKTCGILLAQAGGLVHEFAQILGELVTGKLDKKDFLDAIGDSQANLACAGSGFFWPIGPLLCGSCEKCCRERIGYETHGIDH